MSLTANYEITHGLRSFLRVILCSIMWKTQILVFFFLASFPKIAAAGKGKSKLIKECLTKKKKQFFFTLNHFHKIDFVHTTINVPSWLFVLVRRCAFVNQNGTASDRKENNKKKTNFKRKFTTHLVTWLLLDIHVEECGFRKLLVFFLLFFQYTVIIVLLLL